MSIIHFTEADRLAGKLLEKGNYSMMLTELEGKASKSAKSINYWATFKIAQGPLTGKELKVCFNTESDASILGNLQMMPARDLLKLAAAVNGVKFDEVPLDIDPETLLNRSFEGGVGVQPTEKGGDLINTITGFFTTGAAAAGPSF
jgi:hypothetical protein